MACCVPDLELNGIAIDFNGLDLKVITDSGNVIISEDNGSEEKKNRSLAFARILIKSILKRLSFSGFFFKISYFKI